MTMRDNLEVQYPVLNHSESVANIAINTLNVRHENGVTIKDAFSNKNNSLFIIINNTGDRVGLLTVKAGDAYPNSMLGDTIIELNTGFSAINLADLPRFIKADSSVDIEFNSNFKGKVFAIGKYKFKENERVDW